MIRNAVIHLPHGVIPRNALVRFALLAILLVPAAAGFAAPKGLKAEPLKEAPPAEVAEKVRQGVQAEGTRVRDAKGEPFVDVWLSKSVAAIEPKPELGVKFGMIPEGTVLGVVRFHQKASDFKGNGFPAGVYTFRNGLQPIDGDHQGVTDTRDFVLLSPAKADQKPEPLPTKEAIKLSVQSAGLKHPTVLYLLRMIDEGVKLPRLVEDEDLGLWVLDCELPPREPGKVPVRLGLVLVGTAPEH